MRTLNDYFLFGGGLTAIQTAGNSPDSQPVVPDAGKLVGIVINVDVLIDAETTFDVLKNGTDTTVDATLPDATAANSGVIMALDGDVYVQPGDKLSVTSNGEQTAACSADITYIIRR